MEIWPKGHFSPVHDHGGSVAVVKILHGSIKSEWFNPIYNDTWEAPVLIMTETFHANQTTWMQPHLFQTHRLTNERNDTAAITIQAYGYPDDADYQLDVFWYVLPGENELHEFFPTVDIMFSELVGKVVVELNRGCAPIGQGFCGTQIFNVSTHQCFPDFLCSWGHGDPCPCPVGGGPCGDFCINPAERTCFEEQFGCMVGDGKDECSCERGMMPSDTECVHLAALPGV